MVYTVYTVCSLRKDDSNVNQILQRLIVIDDVTNVHKVKGVYVLKISVVV